MKGLDRAIVVPRQWGVVSVSTPKVSRSNRAWGDTDRWGGGGSGGEGGC